MYFFTKTLWQFTFPYIGCYIHVLLYNKFIYNDSIYNNWIYNKFFTINTCVFHVFLVFCDLHEQRPISLIFIKNK